MKKQKKKIKKKKNLDYKKFYSYNNDPWKIIDHIVISDNIDCQMVNLYPNNNQGLGVIGLHVPYIDTENIIPSNWPSDHASLTMIIELLD